MQSKKVNEFFNLDDLLVFSCGFVSIVVALFISKLSIQWDYSLISLLFWVIVPAGAGILGAISATGFLVGALWRQRKMSVVAIVLMFAALIPSYFGHYYMVYQDGIDQYKAEHTEDLVDPEFISFWEYYQQDITNRIYKFDDETSKKAERRGVTGNWGYAYAFLEIIGFLFGGFIILGILHQKRYCPNCKRYFNTTIVGYIASDELASQTITAFEQGNQYEMSRCVDEWLPNLSVEPIVGQAQYLTADLSYCKGCMGQTIFKMVARAKVNTNSKDVFECVVDDEFARSYFKPEQVKSRVNTSLAKYKQAPPLKRAGLSFKNTLTYKGNYSGWSILLMLLAIPFCAIPIMMMYRTNNVYEPFRFGTTLLIGAILGIPLTAVYCLSCRKIFKNISLSKSDMQSIAIVNFVIFAIFGMFVFNFINGYFDSTPASTYKVLATDVDGEGRHDVYVQSWKKSGKDIVIPVKEDEFNKIVPGTSFLNITTKPGFLGFEWMQNYEVAE